MSKAFEAIIKDLEAGNPPSPDSGFLGADIPIENAALVLIQAPWNVTATYGSGSSRAPDAIVNASHQLDLEDQAFHRPYRAGIALDIRHDHIHELNDRLRPLAEDVIATVEWADQPSAVSLKAVNDGGDQLNTWIHDSALAHLDAGRHVGLVGGDHSTPEGLIQAIAEKTSDGFGILQIDAHHDLRAAYEGFKHSHASIMYNVLEHVAQVEKLVQVSVRDYSREEADYRQAQGARMQTFYAEETFRRQAEGKASFAQIVDEMLAPLPDSVYLSFDIDGLDPSYCPNTGTPVPGGLSFAEAIYILERLAKSGRRVIGFDLCEVVPGKDEWDANVGARILYKLCGCLLHSQGRL